MKDMNIRSSTIEKGLDIAKDFLQSVMKPSLDEVGELFADKVKLWRVKNQVRNIGKVKAIVEKEGIKTKAINMKVLFPYLDAVALEDDETLQDMWANLFVNYIDSERNLTLTVYPEILRQLSSNEAKLLNYIYEKPKKEKYYTLKDKEVGISTEEIVNLERLRLLEEDMEYKIYDMEGWGDGKPGPIYPEYSGRYTLTDFGLDFVFACRRKRTTDI